MALDSKFFLCLTFVDSLASTVHALRFRSGNMLKMNRTFAMLDGIVLPDLEEEEPNTNDMNVEDGTIDPRNLLIHARPQPMELVAVLWSAIFVNNPHRVMELTRYGARPHTRLYGGPTAMDLADKLGRITIIRIFCCGLNVDTNGLSVLLTAIHKNWTTVVHVVMHMGMCGKLALNEGMKVVVWGTAAKYGTPEMLDTLHQDGPFFSWHAYDAWLYFLADEGKNFRVYYRIRDHYRAHEEREMLKFARKGQVMDESPRNQRLPPLLDCLYQLSANKPKLELDYFIMHEATRPLHRDEQ